MLSKEKYIDLLVEESCKRSSYIAVRAGIPYKCNDISCNECDFFSKDNYCDRENRFLEWANSEYIDFKSTCPFCGSTFSVKVADEKDCTGQSKIVCSKRLGGCGASSGAYKTEKEAWDAWNRRVQ